MPATTDPYVTPPPQEERVFNTFRRKVLRPFYSMREVWSGAVILGLLGGVLAWVLWRGAHPEEALFMAPELEAGANKTAIEIYEAPVEPWVEPGSMMRVAAAGGAGGGAALDPFPSGVISEGWRATGPAEVFDETNLYIKINGRETFYKGFGFRKLYCLSLVPTKEGAPGIDIELFDLGSVENALGALAAEASNPEAPPRIEEGGLVYTTRNGGYLTRGNYYVRLVGADDDDGIREKIAKLIPVLRAGFPAGELPWTFELFAGRLQLPPGSVRFEKENVFSFGFATDFYLVKLPGLDAEIYVSRRGSAAEATALADRLIQGFGAMGKPVPAPSGAPEGTRMLRHEYLGTIDAVATRDAHVLGIRLAKTPEEAAGWLARLHTGLSAPTLPAAAEPAEPAPKASSTDEYP